MSHRAAKAGMKVVAQSAWKMQLQTTRQAALMRVGRISGHTTKTGTQRGMSGRIPGRERETLPVATAGSNRTATISTGVTAGTRRHNRRYDT